MTAPRLLVLGTRSGDPEALLAWVSALPSDLALPVVVVGHRLASGPWLAPALQASTALPVRELEDKASLVPGAVHVAPADYHLLVEEVGSVALSTEAPLWGARPAIDPLFESAAESYGAGTIGIVVDGDGSDGDRGLARIAECGGVALSHPSLADVVGSLPLRGTT